jgi:hypothetical protein
MREKEEQEKRKYEKGRKEMTKEENMNVERCTAPSEPYIQPAEVATAIKKLKNPIRQWAMIVCVLNC